MEKRELLELAGTLIRGNRWAALATRSADGRPFASMVAYAPEPQFDGILLHLSTLAEHTQNLLSQHIAALVISEADDGDGDPQRLARITVRGHVSLLAPDSEAYAPARQRYLARLPHAEPRFDFPDFTLFRLIPDEARFVGGFGEAMALSRADLGRAAGLSEQ